jgi:hypothetical protein
MGCCLLAAFLIAGVRRAWFAVFPNRRPVVAAFAPAASRPAPGGVVAPPPPAATPPPARRIGTPLVMAVTVAAYALVTWVLDLLGIVSTPRSLARDALLAGTIAVAVLIALSSKPAAPSRASETGVALALSGVVWTWLSLIDMHALGGIEVVSASAAVELVVHGTGLALLSTGVALLRAPALASRLEGAPA